MATELKVVIAVTCGLTIVNFMMLLVIGHEVAEIMKQLGVQP